MPPRNRLSANGEWWGRRGYWINTVSPDGAWRWDGESWKPTAETVRPDCLEVLDPSSLAANRRGRLSLRQAAGLGPRLLLAWLFAGAVISFGCAFDLVTLIFGVLVGAVVVVVTLPVGIVFLLVESLLGVRSEEGSLVKVIDGRRRNVSTGLTLAQARGADFNSMVEGAQHKLYFTRMTLTLVNYERLGGGALEAAERTAAMRPATRFPGTATEVSIWASELETGALPRICVKTGRPAGTQLKFWFVTRGASFWVLGLLAPGRRASGPLPLIQAWRIAFVTLRVLAVASLIAGILGLASTGAFAVSSRPTAVLVSFGCLALSFVFYFVYAGLRPHAEVYANSTGRLFVMLRDVHPRFVDAVGALEPLPATSGAGDRA